MAIDLKKTFLSGALAGATTASVAAATKLALDIKNKKICPLCTIKRMINKTQISVAVETGYNNSVALTPPMGWSSWNLFASKINENLIMEIADAMKNSGLSEVGYCYVNIDDCWQSSERDSDGKLQCDKSTFSSGIKALCNYVNERGLKLGIYSSNGTLTCEDYPASLRHEAIDADTFAQWGVEYFKYDFCHNVRISEKAPFVKNIELAKDNEPAFVCFKPEDCTLKGLARVDKTEDADGLIKGLCSRNGSFIVKVNADCDCDCTLTLTVQKANDAERFIMAKVNGSNEYHIYSPKSKISRGLRRIQCNIELKQGTNTIEFSNPIGSRMDSSAIQYSLMGRELKRATKQYAEKTGTDEKPIVYSLCEWGVNRPWKWARQAGNLWRTTFDIKPFWASIMTIYEFNVRLAKYASPGGWNDPDMLEVGNGNLTYDENRSHFSLWCMMASPLILGNDVRKFIKSDGSVDVENKIYQILTNKDMIAIDQDPLGVQGRRIKCGLIDILVKPLENARVAVCVFNKGKKETTVSVDLKKIANQGFVNLPSKKEYTIFEIWENKSFCAENSLETTVNSHGANVFIVE